jgi:hypothetical protein
MNRDRRNRLLVGAVAGMWLVAVSALAAFYSPKVIAIAVPGIVLMMLAATKLKVLARRIPGESTSATRKWMGGYNE